jgi:hypothetical protein
MDVDAAVADDAVSRIIGDDGMLGVVYHDCADRADIPERARRLRAAMLRLQATTSFDQVLPIYRELQLEQAVADNDTDLQYLASPTLMALAHVNQRWGETYYSINLVQAHDRMPLYAALRTHITMARLVISAGNVSLLQFMRARQLDLVYIVYLLTFALHSDSPEMLTYLEDQKLVDYREEPVLNTKAIAVSTTLEHSRLRSMEWLLQRGHVTLHDYADNPRVFRSGRVTKKLLELGMEPPKILTHRMADEAIEAMLNHGVPTSYWSTSASAVYASRDVKRMLLFRGWVPHESIQHDLIQSAIDDEGANDPCLNHLLNNGHCHPTMEQMQEMVIKDLWHLVKMILHKPGAFDVSQHNYAFTAWVYKYYSPPSHIEHLLPFRTRVRLRREGPQGFVLV